MQICDRQLRMVRKRIVLSLCLSLVLSGTAFAVGPAEVRSQMTAGAYAEAYIQAEQLGTADGYGLAAECLLSEIMLGQAEKNKKQAKRARKLAEAGLELDPANQSVRLQYAVADGFITRETGDVSAWVKKLPQKTEVIIQAYRTDFPADPRGDGLLGAWHLAIAKRAGDKNAQKWFGASVAQGQALFEKARAVNPNDIIVNVNYAFSLLALKDDDLDSVDGARQILTDVMATEPADHLGRVLQKYAGEALSQIEDRELARDYAGMFLDGEVPVFSEED